MSTRTESRKWEGALGREGKSGGIEGRTERRALLEKRSA